MSMFVKDGLCLGGDFGEEGRGDAGYKMKFNAQSKKYELTKKIEAGTAPKYELFVNCGGTDGSRDSVDGKCHDKKSYRYVEVCTDCAKQTQNICLGDGGFPSDSRCEGPFCSDQCYAKSSCAGFNATQAATKCGDAAAGMKFKAGKTAATVVKDSKERADCFEAVMVKVTFSVDVSQASKFLKTSGFLPDLNNASNPDGDKFRGLCIGGGFTGKGHGKDGGLSPR